MAEVLSQNEIDDLLNTLTNEDDSFNSDVTAIRERKIKEYNFARPSKFSREHLKTLEVIYDNYARAISSYFSTFLRLSSHVEVINVEAVTYREFSSQLNNPVMFGLLNFEPLKGSVMMKMSAKTGFAIIDRILGGEGNELDKEREFTEIEEVLMEKFLSKLCEFMKQPWQSVYEISPRLEKLETNIQFTEVIEPNEIVALITLDISVGELKDVLSICIPYMVIEPIIDRISTKQWFSGTQEELIEDVYKESIENKLEQLFIPIRAILGKTKIDVSDFLELQVGDVIKLDSDSKSELDILVGNVTKFRGTPGKNRSRNSIRINHVEKEGE